VKPANILLRPPLTPDHTFRAVLADFGIAYLIDSARVTTPGTAIGTAAYISPEQVRGHAPTPASDIYSLGLVLLEALSGQRAFAGRTPVEAISARLTTPPDVPGDWGYGWRSLLTAMTAIDPADRPTALEVSVRGRVLDSGADEAELTEAMTAGAGSGLVVPPKPPPPAAAADLLAPPTKVLAPASADATLVLGSREADGPASPAERPTVSPARRRWAVIAGGIALVLAAVVVAVFVWNGSGSTPTAPPDLPQVEEPLGTHLQDLMDEVTP